MIEVAICDGEKNMREYLKGLVKTQDHTCIITTFSSGEQLLNSSHFYDIILLDINIGKINGIEAAKLIREHSDAMIIFITALKEYVFDAFDVDAFHYLLKPVNEEKFQQVFKRAVHEKKESKLLESLLIKIGSTYRKILIEDILYAENNGRKVILHTKEDQIEFYEKMEELEQKLGDRFFRCHRGYLVQLKEIQSYDNTSITLQNGETIFLAKHKYSKFVSQYMKFRKDEK